MSVGGAGDTGGRRAFPPGSGALILAGPCSPCSSSNHLVLVVHVASRAPSSRCAEASPTSGSCSVDNFPAPRSCMVVGSTWQANGFSQCPSTNWEVPPSLCDSFPWHLKVQISRTFYQHGSSEISLHPISHSYVHPNKVQISAGDGVWRDRPWGFYLHPRGGVCSFHVFFYTLWHLFTSYLPTHYSTSLLHLIILSIKLLIFK